MSMTQLLIGILVTSGFFVSALVGRFFRNPTAGIVIGGVCGIAVSVAILRFGLADIFAPQAVVAAE